MHKMVIIFAALLALGTAATVTIAFARGGGGFGGHFGGGGFGGHFGGRGFGGHFGGAFGVEAVALRCGRLARLGAQCDGWTSGWVTAVEKTPKQ